MSGGVVATISLLVLIVAFVLVHDDMTGYYRGLSVLVAVATATLIWGLEMGPSARVARGLSIRPLRGIGRISYGVYLWHWPVILAVGSPAAALAWLPVPLGTNVTRIVIVGAIAGASFILVEQPIRRARVPAPLAGTPRALVTATGGAVTIGSLVAVAVTIGLLTTGSAVPAEARTTGGATELDRLDCTFVVCERHIGDDGAQVVAVVGDSIARSLDLGMIELAERDSWTYLTASAGGCRVTHLLTSSTGNPDDYERCFDTTPSLFDRLGVVWEPDVVVIVENMELAPFVAGDDIVQPGSPRWERAERRELRVVMDSFIAAGARVVFVETAPNVVPALCLHEGRWDDPTCVTPAEEDRLASSFNEIIRSTAASSSGDAAVVSLNAWLCPEDRCGPLVAGVLVRYDGHHFSEEGSKLAAAEIARQMREEGLLEPGSSLVAPAVSVGSGR